MKKVLLLMIVVLGVNLSVKAQYEKRYKISDDLTLVTYGNIATIDDAKNQRCISISIIKDIDDRNTAQANYEIFCEGISKKVIKTGVKEGVKDVVNSVLPGAGKYAATIADFIYDGLCEYEKNNLD